MTHTHFTNPHGLYDANHYSCASDLVTLGRYALENFPFIASTVRTTSITLPIGGTQKTLSSTDDLMRPDEYGHVLVCTAPSKTFNLAGCQASVIYVPDEQVRTRFSEGFSRLAMFDLNAFGYAATIAAYEECASWLDELIEVIETNYEHLRDWAAARHPELFVFPLEGTYLAWVDFRACPGSKGTATGRTAASRTTRASSPRETSFSVPRDTSPSTPAEAR